MVIEDDRFPLGLKVLVVDDDTICLKLIENLLVKCHYKVTTTNKPKEALRMLRENKRRFDIVISDVEMPGIDGIRLLQLVGLEMDIPVIMLSAYSDIKRVMQGVRNGACDYLVKPVRIQELQNIWQHVMRRNSLQTGSDVAGGSASPTGKNNASKAVKHDNKGKAIKETSADDNNDGDDDDDDDDEGEQDIDDPITPKKPRLFWSVELHQKFVDAVNLLGLDKAFPKKILDIMDVEGLTREKVASHLQKYRLYLRKVNNGTNQPGTGLGSLGVEDPHIASLGGGYGVYRSLAGPGRFPGVGSLLDQTAAMRLNTGSGLSLTGLSSSPMLQTPQLPTSNSTFSKFDSLSSTAFQNTNTTNTMFQGISPTSMQMNKSSSCQPHTSMMLDGTTPPLNSRNFSNNSTSLISPSPNTGAFGFGSTTPNLLDLSSRPNWQAPTQSLPITQNVIPSSGAMAPAIPQIQNEPLDIFSGINQHPHIWQNHVPNAGNNSSTLSSQINAVAPTPAENVGFNNNMMGAPPFNPLEGASSQMMQQNEIHKSNDNASLLRFDENFLLDDPKLLCGAGQTSEEYLEDIVGRFFQQGNGETQERKMTPGLIPSSCSSTFLCQKL